MRLIIIHHYYHHHHHHHQRFTSPPSLSFFAFSPPFILFSPLFPPPQSGLTSQPKGYRGALLTPPMRRENDICSHQTRSLGSKYTKMRLWPRLDCKRISGVFYMKRVWWLQMSSIFVKRNLRIKANVLFRSVLTAKHPTTSHHHHHHHQWLL